MCNWYFELINFFFNIIWDPTSVIRVKVKVEAMAEEEGKGLGIEKIWWNRLHVLEDVDWRLSLWEKIASTSFRDKTWNYEGWRLKPSW